VHRLGVSAAGQRFRVVRLDEPGHMLIAAARNADAHSADLRLVAHASRSLLLVCVLPDARDSRGASSVLGDLAARLSHDGY
jgi:hypothetical protein